ncbi:APC family permease [Leucobacter sp. UCMA 4100]|uniref:APC family permease n=1 Tax=Leucobacter TaxID=55968 RepID=UPI001C242ABC|nr:MULTISPECIES: APC family permease [Leucobacter]MDA3146327.1 APC family permease [Leucobacter sp. UCMA 4100]
MSTTKPQVDSGLREGVMSGPELAAQAIASIAPSAVIAFTAAEIFMGAGTGTLYAFALATIVILCVGYIVSMFAKLFPSAGSLYTYVAKGLGPVGAFTAGAALMIGSWGIATGSLNGSVSFFMDTLRLLGFDGVQGTGWTVALTILIGGTAVFFTIQGIRASARVSFVLEIISIVIILVLLIAGLFWAVKAGWNPSHFKLSETPFEGVGAGMVLAILGFVGFSSADALGREAKNPKVAIPRAIMWSALGVGILYIFSAYTQIVVLGDDLATVASPLEAINEKIGMPVWFGPLLVFGVAASFFAVVVAPLNVVGRIIYVMGKEGVLPGSFGRTHEKHLTPHRGLLVAGGLTIAVDVVLILFKNEPMDMLVWIDTYGTYGYMLSYSLVAIAGVVYLRKQGIKNRLVPIFATVSVAAMAYVFYANIWPVPAFPMNVIPYLFLITMVLGFVRFGYASKRDPEMKGRIGNTHTEMMEGIG